MVIAALEARIAELEDKNKVLDYETMRLNAELEAPKSCNGCVYEDGQCPLICARDNDNGVKNYYESKDSK